MKGNSRSARRHCRAKFCHAKRFSYQGFSLVETIIVVAIVAILGAIAAPGWAAFMNTQYLNSGQDAIFQSIRSAQSEAMRQRIPYEANFRDLNGIVQVSVHSVSRLPGDWQSLNLNVRLDNAETTLSQASGIYRVEFSQRGWVTGQLGRLTLMSAGGGRTKRCVFVSTLLGTLRRSGNQATPDASGRYCY